MLSGLNILGSEPLAAGERSMKGKDDGRGTLSPYAVEGLTSPPTPRQGVWPGVPGVKKNEVLGHMGRTVTSRGSKWVCRFFFKVPFLMQIALSFWGKQSSWGPLGLCPFFSTIVLFKHRICFPLAFDAFLGSLERMGKVPLES